MSNCVFGFPIYSDPSVLYAPTVSGGSWAATLPLANVQERELARVARSTNALAASTTFDVDLQVVRPVRVLALLLPNATPGALVRMRGSNVAGDFAAPVYNAGWGAPYPAGQSAESLEGLKPTFVHVLTTAQNARYWRIEVTDTGNPDGYVDVARLVIAGGWQPSRNLNNGARLGLETGTERTDTDGFSAVFNERAQRRTWDFQVDRLAEVEALLNGFQLQRIAGTARQLFFVFDPEDVGMVMLLRSGLCVLRALTALEFAFIDDTAMPFQLTEER